MPRPHCRDKEMTLTNAVEWPAFHCFDSNEPRATACCPACVPIPQGRVIFHESVTRGRWLKDSHGRRYGVMPLAQPGRSFTLGDLERYTREKR